MLASPARLWRAFINFLILLLVGVLILALALALYPPALQGMILWLPIPGVVALPTPGPIPPAPVIDAPYGAPPGGYVAFNGVEGSSGEGLSFACGFVLTLDDGRQVGISAAHATRRLSATAPARFTAPGGQMLVALTGQIARGFAFTSEELTTDYVIWSVERWIDAGASSAVTVDPRGQGQPGESVLVYGRFDNGKAGSRSWPGVITASGPDATWIELEDSFEPGGFSGCPVISRHTGKLLGMAVAGRDRPPVVMGLHPARSLVEKAKAALESQKR